MRGIRNATVDIIVTVDLSVIGMASATQPIGSFGMASVVRSAVAFSPSGIDILASCALSHLGALKLSPTATLSRTLSGSRRR